MSASTAPTVSVPVEEPPRPPGARLVRAARSARTGRYGTAVEALGELGGADSTDPAVLDLLARVHAQRGELARADACWARVVQLDPPSAAAVAAARAGRARIALLRGGRSRRSSTGRWPGWAALVVLTAGAVVAGASLPRLAPGGSDRGSAGQLAAVRRGQAAIADQLDRLRSRVEGPAASPSPARIAAGLAGPGVTVTRRGRSLLVTFDAGLFAGDSRPTPDGRAALAALAARIERVAPAGPLVVTGHTDDAPPPPGSPYRDRVTLGFARAETAADELAAGSGIPLTAIGVRSTGTAEPPFPDDSAADRLRNDTVTVLVGLGPG